MNTSKLLKHDFKLRLRRSVIVFPFLMIYNIQFVYFNLLPVCKHFDIFFRTELYISFLTTKIGLLYILPLTFLALFASYDIYRLKNFSFFRPLPVRSKQVLLVKLIGFNLELFFYSTFQYLVSLILLKIYISPVSQDYPSAHSLIMTYVSVSFYFHILMILSLNFLNAVGIFFFTFISLSQQNKLKKLLSHYLFYVLAAIVFVFIYNNFIDVIMFMPYFTIKKAFIDQTNILIFFNSVALLIGWTTLLCLPMLLQIDNKIDFT
ncbi:MAG TPA: hypothetical protein PK581_02690 [Caldisericia bacterium]|nr:hypothetical protein [Caldisericia bacterium]